MRVTKVRVLPVDGDEKLKAFVTIKIDDCFVIRDLKVIKGATGYFLAMPSKKMKDGTHRDIIHPVGKETRQMLEEEVLKEFRKICVNPEDKNIRFEGLSANVQLTVLRQMSRILARDIHQDYHKTPHTCCGVFHFKPALRSLWGGVVP